jgi:AraC-like DNA-binding protein
MPRASHRWPGLFFVGIGRALYIGPASDTTLHAHHAIQVCLGLDRSFRLRCHPHAPWRSYSGVVIGSDQPHELATGGHAVALFYIEPEGEDGRTLAPAASETRVKVLPARLLAALRASIAQRAGSELDAIGAARLFGEVMDRLGITASPRRPLDPRIAAALRMLRSAKEHYPPSRDLACSVGLSASRLRHVFAAEIGMSFRRYVLWLRLSAILDALVAGSSLTAAAHAAGFADSAHLSRTFRRMFGIAPSAAPPITQLLPVDP